MAFAAFFVTEISPKTMNCDYSYNSSYNGYICNVRSIKIVFKNDRRIDQIISWDNTEINKTNVKGLDCILKTVNYFPTNLESFFPNLTFIRIDLSNLTEIKMEDLKPFSNLTTLEMQFNKIKVIDANLFSNHPMLKDINFDFNSIEKIGRGAFSGLNDLRLLKLSFNECLTGPFFAKNHKDVLNLIKTVEDKCSR